MTEDIGSMLNMSWISVDGSKISLKNIKETEIRRGNKM